MRYSCSPIKVPKVSADRPSTFAELNTCSWLSAHLFHFGKPCRATVWISRYTHSSIHLRFSRPSILGLFVASIGLANADLLRLRPVGQRGAQVAGAYSRTRVPKKHNGAQVTQHTAVKRPLFTADPARAGLALKRQLQNTWQFAGFFREWACATLHCFEDFLVPCQLRSARHMVALCCSWEPEHGGRSEGMSDVSRRLRSPPVPEQAAALWLSVG